MCQAGHRTLCIDWSFCLTPRQQEEVRQTSSPHCAGEKTEDQKGLVTSPRLHSEARAAIQGTDLSGLKTCVLSSPAVGQGQQQVVWREVLQQGGKKSIAMEVGGPQR